MSIGALSNSFFFAISFVYSSFMVYLRIYDSSV